MCEYNSSKLLLLANFNIVLDSLVLGELVLDGIVLFEHSS